MEIQNGLNFVRRFMENRSEKNFGVGVKVKNISREDLDDKLDGWAFEWFQAGKDLFAVLKNPFYHGYDLEATVEEFYAFLRVNEIEYEGERNRIGVLRSYFTRHGAGPFVTEDVELTKNLAEPHNSSAGWQGRFRAGWLEPEPLSARTPARPMDDVRCQKHGAVQPLQALSHLLRMREVPHPNGPCALLPRRRWRRTSERERSGRPLPCLETGLIRWGDHRREA